MSEPCLGQLKLQTHVYSYKKNKWYFFLIIDKWKTISVITKTLLDELHVLQQHTL